MLNTKTLAKSLENYVNEFKNNPLLHIKDTIEFKKEIESKKRLKNSIKDNMRKDSSYLSWLAGFTKKHNSFDTETSSYYNDLSEVDKINLKNFHLFFEVIYEYAKGMKIKPNVKKNSKIDVNFLVNYEDFYFKTGVIMSKSTLCYCEKRHPKKGEYVINYANIINHSKEKKLTRKR